MRPSDVVTLSWRQLKERKLRSILTILTVAVGVTTIIALSAQVEGARVSIIGNLGRLGSDTIIVSVIGRMPFTDVDVARLMSLEGVSKVIPMLRMNARVPGLDSPAFLIGASARNLADLLGEIKIIDGTIYYDAPAPQALIGHDVAVDSTGQTRYKASQPILLQIGQRQLTFTVVGVLDIYGIAGVMQPDTAIFIPLEYYNNLVKGSGYTVLIVKTLSIEGVDPLVELIRSIFGGRASITSIKYIAETVTNITNQINLLLLAIAGTSFIAAGLGTLNIMMISVLERVREIGILKAIGMKDKGVLLIYIIQGGLVGFFGSAAGIALGCGVSYLLPIFVANMGQGTGAPRVGMGMGMSTALSYTPVISLLYIITATAVSIVVTLLASAYPAWRASRLRPIEALRYE